MKRVLISIGVSGDFDLTTVDVWPDGDDPQRVTAQAVAETMEACGSKRTVLDDWNFLDDLEVTVTVDDETVFVWEPRANENATPDSPASEPDSGRSGAEYQPKHLRREAP